MPLDFGDLVFSIAILFGLLIFVFETLERRREKRLEEIDLEEIAREYRKFRQLGIF